MFFCVCVVTYFCFNSISLLRVDFEALREECAEQSKKLKEELIQQIVCSVVMHVLIILVLSVLLHPWGELIFWALPFVNIFVTMDINFFSLVMHEVLI